jgi:dTDP-4-dehydrorhamnose 3,5-epimerase
MSAPTKDAQTVTPDGLSVAPRIEGLIIRRQAPTEDERGELCEIYNPAWNVHPAPLVYAYHAMIRPGKVKGWVVHRKQDDRIFVCTGVARFGCFDDRPDSPTYRQLNVFTISERNHALVVIPRGVYHALQNVGTHDMTFVNLPTAPYDHADPDKYRLPVKNDLIPFAFEDQPGW